MLLVLLITFLAPITLKASWSSITVRLRDFCFWFLLLETFMIGAVTARDLFQFFLYWELLLVPMLFIIGRWGSERRVYAALKFFVYTMVGSLPMLAALVYVYFRYLAAHPGRAAELPDRDLAKLGLTFRSRSGASSGFGLSFAIKLPLFPLHTWLPDAHTEAPTPGSIVLAGVLLKMGGYGFLAIGIPLFPDAARAAAPWLITLSLIGIVYGALVAMVQPDLKRLVAFSSVSHMGVVTLGIFTATAEGLVRERGPDGRARHLDRRALPARRIPVRAAPHPPDRRVRRHREADAALRDGVRDRRALEHRAAGAERVRRRAPRLDRRPRRCRGSRPRSRSAAPSSGRGTCCSPSSACSSGAVGFQRTKGSAT